MRFSVVSLLLVALPVSAFAQINRIQQARQTVQQANTAAAQRQAPMARQTPYARQPTSSTRQMGWYAPPGALASGAGAHFGGGGTGGATGTAATASAGGLSTAINMFYLDTGRLPKTSEGLNVLIQQPPGVRNWKGPYVTRNSWRDTFMDPWGNQYRYINTTRPGAAPSFSIRSNGPDGVANTADDLGSDG